MDLAERLKDLQSRNEQLYTDEEAKERFLELLSDGVPMGRAGKDVGRSSTWFKRRRNPDAVNYDAAFTERFNEITAPGGEYKSAMAEDVVSAMYREAMEGNVRAQEKLLAAYSGDFSFLRPQISSGAVNVEQLQVFFSELSLQQLLELQSARKRELPVLDA